MEMPNWFKPALLGGVAGVCAVWLVGFGAAGWMTSKEAKQMAESMSRDSVVSAMVPVCVEKAERDPNAAQTLEKMKTVGNYERIQILMKAGWATMPGTQEPERSVANDCVEHLAKAF